MHRSIILGIGWAANVSAGHSGSVCLWGNVVPWSARAVAKQIDSTVAGHPRRYPIGCYTRRGAWVCAAYALHMLRGGCNSPKWAARLFDFS